MEAVRTKDKLFLALVIPVALAAGYFYLWRADAVRRVAELEREDADLVAAEDFPGERAKWQQLLKSVRAELEEEERRPTPAAKVKANADDSIAARERAVLEVFRREGLLVGKSVNRETDEVAARDVLTRTGLRPQPVCREYSILGGYPKICAALAAFAAREMAVIPERVEMSEPGRWTLALWL